MKKKMLFYICILMFMIIFIVHDNVMADELNTETVIEEESEASDNNDIQENEERENEDTEIEYDDAEIVNPNSFENINDIEDVDLGVTNETITITFNSKEGFIYGNPESKKGEIVLSKGKALYSVEMDRPGYKCVGWKSEKSGIEYLYDYDSENRFYEYKPESDESFTAIWKEAYKITFKSGNHSRGFLYYTYENGEEKETYKTEVIEYVEKGNIIGDFGTLEEDEGYICVGWKSEKSGIEYLYDYDSENRFYEYKPESDESFTAVWKEAYKITYKSEEGYLYGDPDNREDTLNIEKGKEIYNVPYGNYRPGYELIGWKSEKSGIEYSFDYEDKNSIHSYVPKSDETFKAIWKEAYAITFKSPEGYLSPVPEQEKELTRYVGKGEKIRGIRNLDERPGYVCRKWKSEKTGKIYTGNQLYNYIPTSNEVFVAVWEEAYTVTLKTGEGRIEGLSGKPISVRKGDAVGWVGIPSIDSDVNKVFIGWEREGTNEIYYGDFFNNYYNDSSYDSEHFYYKEEKLIDNFIPTEDVTFIAKWTGDVYKINYDANGGLISDNSAFLVPKGSRIGDEYLNQNYGIDREGYILTGYKVKETGEILSVSTMESADVYIDEYIPKSDITLIAQWEKAYKVTFKSSEGYLNGEKNLKECVINVKKGEKMPAIAGCSNYTGHVVTGFKLDKTGEIYSPLSSGLGEKSIWDYVPETDVTFTVIWSSDIYNITILDQYDHHDNHEYLLDSEFPIPKGSSLKYLEYYWFGHILPSSEEKMAFKGYKIEGDTSGKVYPLNGDATYDQGDFYKIVPTSDTTLIPVWEEGYYVSIDGDGGWHYIGKDGDYEKKSGRLWCSQLNVDKCAVLKGTNLVIGDYYELGIFDEGAMFKKGYDFVGWTVVGKENKIYKFGEPIKIDSDMTIKAVWKKKGEIEKPRVKYSTHVQTYAWQNEVKNGEMSGTVGQSKRLEAIKINLENAPYSGDIEYRTHVQSYGWMNWAKNGNLSGTSGEAKRLEAIQIRLTGEMAKYYDVYYRVQAQTYGWLGWAKNGEYAGTAGFAKRLEAIQILLVEKGSKVTGNTKVDGKTLDKLGNISSATKQTPGSAYIAKQPNISYRTHVQSFGWQSFVSNGAMSGTSGKAKRLEGIEIKLGSLPYAGGVRYTTHVQTYGWQGKENDPTTWKKDGAMAGTSGEAKRLEAIRIGLYGEMAEKYDIYYRVHAQSYGWLSWAKNGAPAGTAGYAKRLEGIQIVLVEKGKPAPGKTYNGITANRNESYISK